MVVDDQLAFRKVAITLIAATEGCDVVGEADTGEAAVHQAARLIREPRPEAVVLLMSTCNAADLPAEASRCGATGYIHKEQLDAEVLRKAWRDHQPGGR